MAYLPDDPNTQNANQAPTGQNASQAPITSSPAPASGGTSGKTINQASSSAPAQPFTNLQSYLTANAPQIQQQGQQIAGTLNDQYGTTTGAIDKAANDFKGSVAQGYTPNNAQVINNFSTDPTKVANDPNAAASFKGMLNDSYNGPGSFETAPQYGAVNDQVVRGQGTAAQVSTPGGLQSYLMGQNPNETQGMATLDSSLLGANPGVAQTVQTAAKQFDNLPGYLTNAANQSNAAVQSAIAEAQAAKQAASGAFNTQAQAFNTQVGSDYQKAIDAAKGFNTNYNDITAKLGHIMPTGLDDGLGTLSAAEQNGLGITNDSLNRYAQADSILNQYNNGGELSRYLTSQLGNADVAPVSTYLSGGHIADLPQSNASVASAQQYATAKALAQLGGDKYSSPLDLSQASLAGTYKPDGQYQTFDQTRANGLFDQVSARDKAVADQGIAGSHLTPGDYQGALTGELTSLQKDPTAFTPGSGASLSLAALNRLVNGFGAPDPKFDPLPAAPDPMHPINNGGNFIGFV